MVDLLKELEMKLEPNHHWAEEVFRPCIGHDVFVNATRLDETGTDTDEGDVKDSNSIDY